AVGETIGRVDLAAVGRDGDAPRAATHLLADRRDDLVRRRVDHVDGARAAAGDVDAVGGRVDGDLDGTGVEAEVDRLDNRVGRRVDDGDRPADLGRHVGPRAVVRELHHARPVAHQEVLDDLQVLAVDHRHGVGRLGRDVDPLAVGADGHALGLDPDAEDAELFARLHVVAGTLGDRLQRGPDLRAVGADGDALGVA